MQITQAPTTKAVFYILKDPAPKMRNSVACRLTEKAFQSGHKIFILTTNQKDAEEMDASLWTFRDISFIPHQIYNQAAVDLPPVLVGINENAVPENFEVLINLTNSIPSTHKQFSHIIEIITPDDESRALGRKRYKFYQEQGYKIENYNV